MPERRVEKLDLKKSRKELFSASHNRFVPIDVPPVSYLMVDGHGYFKEIQLRNPDLGKI